MNDQEIQIYELGYHLIPTLTEEALPELVSEIKAYIEKEGGAFISEEFPRKTGLEYTMEKSSERQNERFNSAYFGWIKFEKELTHISSLQEALKAMPQILRFILIKTVRESTLAPKKQPSVRSEAKPEAKQILKSAPIPDKKKDKPTQISEEELDRTIEELVAE